MIPRILLLGSFLVTVGVHAATFEGKVSFKLTTARGQAQEIRQSIKGDKVRIEMPGQNTMGGIIIDSTKREMTVTMDAQKMYLVMPMANPAAPAGGTGKTEEAPQLEKTGEKEKILGYLAEKFVATQGNSQTELWLAEGLGAFMGLGNGGPAGGRGGRGAAPQPWERALSGKDLFPLRVVTHDKDSKENFRMEVTAIEKQTLPDSLFAPPADFQKMDMGGMMGGMKGLPGVPNLPGMPGK